MVCGCGDIEMLDVFYAKNMTSMKTIYASENMR
jgi:hypothetical protein